jgi:3-hydroxyacyl-[acyl-carrier-protein] dehydratase
LRFLFVDEILELVPGEKIRASKKIRGNEEYFQDHFPGFPVVPGVLLVEMMAQTAGKCLDAEKKTRGKAMLARITSANFRAWVGPGQETTIGATIRTNRTNFATAECHIEVANRIVCTAELFFTFVPLEKFASDYRDEILESFLCKTSRGSAL